MIITNGKGFQILIYVFLYIILIFSVISIYFIISKSISKKMGLFFVYLFCVIYGGIRYCVGSDYENYLIYYKYIMYSNYSFLEVLNKTKEIGFNALLFWTAKITNFDYGIFWTTSIIIYFLVINAIKKYSSNITFSLFLFFALGYHLFSLNGLRQTIALFLFIHFVYRYIKGKYISAMVIALLMCSFHSTAIIILIIFVVFNILKIKFNKKNYFSTIVFSIALFIIYPYIGQIVSSLLVKFFDFTKYADYFSDLQTNQQSKYMTFAIISIGIMYISITGLMLLFKKDLIKSNPILERILPLLLIGFPFVLIGARNWPVVRMAFYFFQFTIFTLSSFMEVMRKRYNGKRYLIFIVFGIIIYCCIYIICYQDNWYFQYSTYFGK